MESIYYVATFLCHRACHHCYEDRFRPYYGAKLRRVVEESVVNHQRIIENLPDHMTYLDLNDCEPETGRPREKIGRVILAGGEVLLEPVRERVLYSALDFLQYQHQGSEVSVEPNGDVYPCCIKTKAPIGNLLEEKLERILDSLVGNPVYEALSMGHPERMGISRGWTVERFIEASTIQLPSGKLYQNFCVGCDKFHEEVLIPTINRSRP